MPEHRWVACSVGDCLETSFAGEWGSDASVPNAVVLRATDIDDEGHVVGDGAARLIPGGKLLEKQLKHGDILLEGSGGGPDKPVGRVALFEAGVSVDPTICSNFFKTLRPNRTIVNERFLWRKLGWFYRQPKLLALQQQTTGIINLNFAEYLEAEIDVPTNLPEQAKIAEVLDALDATIRQTESIIEKLKQVKLGLLHDLFTRGVDANGELRPPQGESPDLYKGSPLGWIPRAWTTAKLVEIADIRSGATPSRSAAARYFRDGGTPWVKTLDLNEGIIEDTDECITDAALQECSCEKLRAGTVLIAMYGGWEQIGRTAMLGIAAATNQAISGLAFRPGAPEPEYILRALQYARPRWGRIAASTRKDPNITKSDVASFEISFPVQREEQIAIVKTMRSLLRRLELEVALSSKLRRQEVGLKGRVRITALLE